MERRLIRCPCPWRAQDGALPSSWWDMLAPHPWGYWLKFIAMPMESWRDTISLSWKVGCWLTRCTKRPFNVLPWRWRVYNGAVQSSWKMSTPHPLGCCLTWFSYKTACYTCPCPWGFQVGALPLSWKVGCLSTRCVCEVAYLTFQCPWRVQEVHLPLWWNFAVETTWNSNLFVRLCVVFVCFRVCLFFFSHCNVASVASDGTPTLHTASESAHSRLYFNVLLISYWSLYNMC